MKLLARSQHFEWPALYPQALADFQDLITLAKVDRDGPLPSFLPGAAGMGGWIRGYSSGSL